MIDSYALILSKYLKRTHACFQQFMIVDAITPSKLGSKQFTLTYYTF